MRRAGTTQCETVGSLAMSLMPLAALMDLVKISLSNNGSKSGGRTVTILIAGGAGLTLVLSKACALGGNNIGTSGCHTGGGISNFLNGRSYKFHIIQGSCHLYSCTILWNTLFAMEDPSEFTPVPQ